MTTRADVDRLSAANREIVRMARRDLAALFAGLDLSRPDVAAGVLADAVPMLVREYGNLASAVAAEWYEEIRVASGAAGVHREVLSPGAKEGAVRGSTRAGVAGLFAGDTAGARDSLGNAMERHISFSTRDTIRLNTKGDPAKPRYARVPSGGKTCAFCELLASRGFDYPSEAAADDEWHDNCGCQVVVEFGPENNIEGYDPDAMYDRYREAYRESDGTMKGTLAVMRRQNPDAYTDGVVPSK